LNCCGHRDHHRHQGHQHDGRYTHERCALGERVRATGAGERGPCRDGGTRGMMTSRQGAMFFHGHWAPNEIVASKSGLHSPGCAKVASLRNV
jgi:hypothetical protein